jgi:hypothetical protein
MGCGAFAEHQSIQVFPGSIMSASDPRHPGPGMRVAYIVEAVTVPKRASAEGIRAPIHLDHCEIREPGKWSTSHGPKRVRSSVAGTRMAAEEHPARKEATLGARAEMLPSTKTLVAIHGMPNWYRSAPSVTGTKAYYTSHPPRTHTIPLVTGSRPQQTR